LAGCYVLIEKFGFHLIFPLMLRLSLPILRFVFAFLLVVGRSWGQAVPKPLAHVLQQYQPLPLAKSGTSVALGTCGTVQLPSQAGQRRTGTKDSDRGEVRLDKLLIEYDIGLMAGVHVSSYNRDGDRFPQGNPTPFSVYEERTVGALQATLGLRPSRNGTSTEVVATLQDLGGLRNSPMTLPANFWAQVHTKAELQQFLAVVFSYRPTTKP
jgi:hypothetical protein